MKKIPKHTKEKFTAPLKFKPVKRTDTLNKPTKKSK